MADDSNHDLYIGIGLGVFILFLLIVLIFILCCKKFCKKFRKNRDQDKEALVPSDKETYGSKDKTKSFSSPENDFSYYEERQTSKEEGGASAQTTTDTAGVLNQGFLLDEACASAIQKDQSCTAKQQPSALVKHHTHMQTKFTNHESHGNEEVPTTIVAHAETQLQHNMAKGVPDETLVVSHKLEQSKGESPSEDEKRSICVMGINQENLDQITAALLDMQKKEQISRNVSVVEKKLDKVLSISKEDFKESGNVILVGTPEPRNMLISDSEPSQLGVAYRKACELGKNIFMIYAGTEYKDKLKDSQAFHKSLDILLDSQRAIGSLAKQKRFISVKYKRDKDKQKLNKTQTGLIKNWINECLNI